MEDPEDDWEYEYDDNEVEEFYITLDISNVPAFNTAKVRKSSLPSATKAPRLKTRLRATNEDHGASDDTADSADTQLQPSIGNMQISGLHTTNPLIRYGNHLLSCKWNSTVGTDMYFVKPDPELGEPLQRMYSADLLAISSTKLMAVEARLRPRDEVVQQTTVPDTTPSDPMDTSGAPNTHVTRPPTASFLQKLNDAKAKRGDRTRLVVTRSAGAAHLVADERTQNGEGKDSNIGAPGEVMQVEDREGLVSPQEKGMMPLSNQDTDVVMGGDEDQAQ